jgi:hypothetical protein
MELLGWRGLLVSKELQDLTELLALRGLLD